MEKEFLATLSAGRKQAMRLTGERLGEKLKRSCRDLQKK